MSKSSIYYQKIGDSYLGHSIDSWLFSNSNQADVLIIGGVHGDEIEGILIAEEIKEVFLEKKVNLNFDKIIQAGLAIVPKINPDGSQLNQ
jgi:predicted deacylase